MAAAPREATVAAWAARRAAARAGAGEPHGMCTSIAAQGANGTLVLARNMDWNLPPSMRALLVDPDFVRGGRKIFRGTGAVGVAGLLNGMTYAPTADGGAAGGGAGGGAAGGGAGDAVEVRASGRTRMYCARSGSAITAASSSSAHSRRRAGMTLSGDTNPDIAQG